MIMIKMIVMMIIIVIVINNGNRTAEWSPIRCVIIRVINKIDDRVATVGYV